MRSPQGHGIKNMTHYRVLKQHTQPELNQAFGLNFALASNSATLEHLSVRRQPQKYCSRSHRSTLCRSEFAAGGPRGKPRPFGSGLYFRQVHPTDVKPISHDPGHINFPVSFQPFQRTHRYVLATPRRSSVSTKHFDMPTIGQSVYHSTTGVRHRTPAIIKEHLPCLLPLVAPSALVPDPTS